MCGSLIYDWFFSQVELLQITYGHGSMQNDDPEIPTIHLGGHAMEVIRAVYQNGMFVPKDVCVLPEGTEVELIVQTVNVELPIGSDPDEQGGVAEEFTE